MQKRRIKRRQPSKLYKEAMTKWSNLLNKGIDVNFTEFYLYLHNVKKANKLGEKVKKRDDSLSIPRFTESESVFKNRETFEKYARASARVNKRGYIQEQNAIIRERFIENLKANTDVSNETINRIKNMTNAEFKKFAKDNAELNSIIYGFYETENSAKNLTVMLELRENSIESRVNHLYEE